LQIGLCELGGEAMEESDGNECVEQSKTGSMDRSYVDCTQTGSVWLPACSVMRKGKGKEIWSFGRNKQSINKEIENAMQMPYRKRLPPASGR
jgi:hypothetical protein